MRHMELAKKSLNNKKSFYKVFFSVLFKVLLVSTIYNYNKTNIQVKILIFNYFV